MILIVCNNDTNKTIHLKLYQQAGTTILLLNSHIDDGNNVVLPTFNQLNNNQNINKKDVLILQQIRMIADLLHSDETNKTVSNRIEYQCAIAALQRMQIKDIKTNSYNIKTFYDLFLLEILDTFIKNDKISSSIQFINQYNNFYNVYINDINLRLALFAKHYSKDNILHQKTSNKNQVILAMAYRLQHPIHHIIKQKTLATKHQKKLVRFLMQLKKIISQIQNKLYKDKEIPSQEEIQESVKYIKDNNIQITEEYYSKNQKELERNSIDGNKWKLPTFVLLSVGSMVATGAVSNNQKNKKNKTKRSKLIYN